MRIQINDVVAFVAGFLHNTNSKMQKFHAVNFFDQISINFDASDNNVTNIRKEKSPFRLFFADILSVNKQF